MLVVERLGRRQSAGVERVGAVVRLHRHAWLLCVVECACEEA